MSLLLSVYNSSLKKFYTANLDCCILIAAYEARSVSLQLWFGQAIISNTALVILLRLLAQIIILFSTVLEDM